MGKILKVSPGGVTQQVEYRKPESFTLETIQPDGSGGLYLIGDHEVYRLAKDGAMGLVAKGFKNLHNGAAALGPDRSLYLGDGPDLVRVSPGGAAARVARLAGPVWGIAVSPQGATYATDHNEVYRIDKGGKAVPLTGGKSGRADGPVAKAAFLYPTGLALDAQGNLYVKESGRHENSDWMHIRKITPAGQVSTFAKIRRSAP